MFTANFRSLPMIGLQIGSPSRLTTHRRRLAEVDRRRIRLDPRDLLGRDLAPVDAGQHAVERDHPLLLRDHVLDLRHHLADLLPRHGREVGLRDLQDGVVDQPLLGGHLGVGLELDAAEGGLLRPLRRPGHGGIGDQALLVDPARHLRLVHDDLAAARRGVRARPSAVDRGRGRRRGRRLGGRRRCRWGRRLRR